MPTSMPAIFLAHGSPLLLDDQPWVDQLGAWAGALPRPRAILILSAHWLDAPATIGATRTMPLVYDFYGFPDRFYQVTYAAPGAPELAAQVRGALAEAGIASTDNPGRGLDHGAYIPLIAMYPGADIPVLQLSLPTLEPGPLLALGRALAPLRQAGVLVIGSGFITHNMRALSFRPGTPTPSWASDFDAWTRDAIARKDLDLLGQYRERAPGARESLPTVEHFVPLLVSAGMSADRVEPIAFPIDGFTYGSFSKRSVQFG
jgi:4,5-DOPA dioxygenase extradiol